MYATEKQEPHQALVGHLGLSSSYQHPGSPTVNMAIFRAFTMGAVGENSGFTHLSIPQYEEERAHPRKRVEDVSTGQGWEPGNFL